MIDALFFMVTIFFAEKKVLFFVEFTFYLKNHFSYKKKIHTNMLWNFFFNLSIVTINICFKYLKTQKKFNQIFCSTLPPIFWVRGEIDQWKIVIVLICTYHTPKIEQFEIRLGLKSWPTALRRLHYKTIVFKYKKNYRLLIIFINLQFHYF